MAAQVLPPAVFRPSLFESAAIAVSRSGSGDLALVDHGVWRYVEADAASVRRFELSAACPATFEPADFQVRWSIAYERQDFAGPFGDLLDHLEALSCNLELGHPLNANWTGIAVLRPGYYGSLRHLSGKGVNIPVLLMVRHAPAGAMTWSLGLAADSFARYPVLPVAGLQLDAGAGWKLALGYPATALTWEASTNCRWWAAVKPVGGSYRALPRIFSDAGTLVDFQELRAGIGLDWAWGTSFTLSVEGGRVLDRKIELHRRVLAIRGTGTRDYRYVGYDGGRATYLTLALTWSR